MAFLLFLAALCGIVVFAVVVNWLTGTKASYLDGLRLDAGERELWRDDAADFALVPRLARAKFMSFARMRRHSVIWTDQRILIAQKALLSSRRMLTHQISFAHGSARLSSDARQASSEFFGGFY